MEMLGLTPDVACFAKLLTAGMVPMSVTLATAEVFEAFAGDTKAQALLHGHSYTAHPIGCQVR
jgi:bifunctional dethiobiotin synthetase / adenosylmethionine---8-amino-7-oxononanoate aminotransferase